jgi:hypothetical protein
MENVSSRAARSKRARDRKQLAAAHEQSGRPAGLEQYGSNEVRAPYLEMSIGRLVIGGDLREIADSIGRQLLLNSLQPLGLIIFPGHKIAPKTRFGMIDAGRPRLEPEEVIERLIEKMRSTDTPPAMRLGESSAEPIEVSVAGILPRKRAKGFKAAALVNDVPSNDYPTGQLYGEQTAISLRLGYHEDEAEVPLDDIRHFIYFAKGQSKDLTSFQSAAFVATALRVPKITLGPLGPMPLPKSSET